MNRVENITLSNFRVFQGDIDFDFRLDSGEIADIIVIHAPNGTGKTSFFDAVEWGLTGQIHRLDETIGTECSGSILKNRYIANGEEAFVKILCESGDTVERKTNRRSHNKDYNKGTLKQGNHIVDYNDWKALILPHSRIDGFVAASNPGEKFKEWGDLWDSEGKSMEAFKFISGLKKHTEKRCISLKEEVLGLKEIIENTKIEDKIFNEINTNVGILNRLGSYEFNNIQDMYDFNSFNKLDIEIISLNERLKKEVNQLSSESDKIIDLTSRFPIYINNITYLKVNKEKSSNLSKKIDEKKKYNSWEKELIESKKKLSDVKKESDELSKLESAGKVWLEEKERIDNLRSNVKKITSNIKEILVSKEDCKLKINKNIEKRNLLDNELENAKKIKKLFEEKFKKIEQLEKSISLLTGNISTYEVEKEKRELDVFKLKKKSSDILNLKLDSSKLNIELIKLRIREVDVADLDISEIESNLKTLEKQQEQLEELRRNQKNIERSITIHDQMVVDAVKLIEERGITVCPVCKANYDDVESLLLSVKSNFNKEILKDDKSEEIERCQELIMKSLENIDKLTGSWNQHLESIRLNIKKELDSSKMFVEEKHKELKRLTKDRDNKRQKLIDIKKYYYKNGITNGAKITTKEIDEWFNRLKNNLDTKLNILTCNYKSMLRKRHLFEMQINQYEIKLEKDDLNINKFDYDQKNMLYDNLYRKYELDYSYILLKDRILLNKNEENKLYNVIKILEENINSNLDAANYNLESMSNEKKEIEEKFNTYSIQIKKYKQEYSELSKATIISEAALNKKRIEIEEKMKLNVSIAGKVSLIKELLNKVKIDSSISHVKDKLINKEKEIIKVEAAFRKIDNLYIEIKNKFQKTVSRTFNEVLSNDIFSKIEAHPIMNKIDFDISLAQDGSPELKILVSDNNNDDQYLPEWYFSSAQLNALALSMFLSKAISKIDTPLNTLFIDDPIGHFDDINVISFIDVIRSINERSDFQIVLSTHDESIYKLMKMKLSDEFYSSKFIELTNLIKAGG